MAAKFEIKKASNGEFMFNLLAGNGEIILSSEMYKAKASATNGVESVKKNAGDDKKYERKSSSGGKPYFVLKAANGEVIGKSQMYASEATMEAGIDAVKKAAAGAAVEDKA